MPCRDAVAQRHDDWVFPFQTVFVQARLREAGDRAAIALHFFDEAVGSRRGITDIIVRQLQKLLRIRRGNPIGGLHSHSTFFLFDKTKAFHIDGAAAPVREIQ